MASPDGVTMSACHDESQESHREMHSGMSFAYAMSPPTTAKEGESAAAASLTASDSGVFPISPPLTKVRGAPDGGKDRKCKSALAGVTSAAVSPENKIQIAWRVSGRSGVRRAEWTARHVAASFIQSVGW